MLAFPFRKSDGIQVGEGDQAGIEPNYERQARLAKERANKLFAGRVGRWWWIIVGHDERGQRVEFCWSRHRNEFGFFLTWRETFKRYTISEYRKLQINPEHDVVLEHWDARKQQKFKDVYRRYDFAARRSKKRCKEIAQERAARWKDEHAKEVSADA